MKKSKLIKEYIEVQAFEVKEYLTRCGTLKFKRKKVEVIKKSVFEIKGYNDLIKSKLSFLNEILHDFVKIYNVIKSPFFIITFLVVCLLFIAVKKIHKIESKFDLINGSELYDYYEKFEVNIDSLELKINEWKLLLDRNKSLVKIRNNQSFWKTLNINDYSYNLKGGACFGGYNYDIKVKDNKVISISSIDGVELTLEEFFNKYEFNPSINQIFNVFETVLSSYPDGYIINYDSILKYPKNAFFDFKNCIIDEEGCWEISNLKFEKKVFENKQFYNKQFITC